MSISSRVAAWLCIGVLGVGAPAHAGNEQWGRRPATESLEEQCGDGVSDEPCLLGNAERRQLVEDVVEYTYR